MGAPDRTALLAAAAALLLITAVPPADAAGKNRPARTSQSGAGQVMYRWVDDGGVTRISQSLPPEQAGRAYEVLNARGIVIQSVAADPALADPAVREQALAERRAAEQQAEEMARRDAMLLNAYLSVEDIEALRDRRLEMMSSQIQVTDNYLQDLRRRLTRLQREARRYQPYSDDPQAPPMDEKLAAELSDTLASIQLYEKNLEEARARQEELVEEFAADIVRFLELTARQ